MKKLLVILLFLPGLSLADSPTWPATSTKGNAGRTIDQIYGAFTTACTQTAVTSTGANRTVALMANRRYVIYGYTSSSDFTGIAIKCLQGGSDVTVAGAEGKKIPAGSQDIWWIPASATYISCQTGSGSGFYDVCPLFY